MLGYTGTPTAGAQIIAQSGVAVPLTGTVAETTLATVQIPPMGPNDQLEVEALFTFVGAAGNRTPLIKLGATVIAGVAIGNANFAAVLRQRVANRNATNSQVFQAVAGTGAYLGVTSVNTSPSTTSAEQTNAGIALTITGQLAVATDTIRLESYRVQLFKKG